MEQLVILVLIGLISLINWIVQKSGEARAQRKTKRRESPEESFLAREEPEPVEARTPSDESRGEVPMRRLMEALGVELSEVEAPSPPPPLPSLVEEANRFESWTTEEEVSPPAPRRTAQRPTVPPRPAEARRQQTPLGRKRVGDLLTAPHGLRHGILLSEILGPPKALRKE